MHMNIVLKVCIFAILYIIYMFAGAAVVSFIGECYEENDPHRFLAVRFYFPSGKIITQYAFSNTVLQ